MFQDSRLLPWRTVRDNLHIALEAADIPEEQWAAKVADLLRMLRIEAFADSWPLNLSGGQRHRVAIARALAIEPAFILMDEPFSTLDEVTARFLRTELLDVWQRTGTTIVFVTHSIREAVFLADTVNLMTKGPGQVFEARRIPVPRPRAYEDPKLAEVEGAIVETVLEAWGYYDQDIAPEESEAAS
jgi:NitT/TauT family transport system ATP-binding protein